MPSMSAVAIRHVHFEDLGSFAPVLERRGYRLTYFDIGVHTPSSLDALTPDLLVILGGPIGVYEDGQFPFLRQELDLVAKRIAGERPTLGICLGSQVIARALGARVYPMGAKEIGFSPIELTPEGLQSSLSIFADDGVVLHWHGDTFDLPRGAIRLAYTRECSNQAFSFGPKVLGLQFHAEVPLPGFERWLIGHSCELAAAGVPIVELRAAAECHAMAVARKSAAFLDRWLTALHE